MRVIRALSVLALATLTGACTTIIEPVRVTTFYYEPVPVYRPHVVVRPEVYHFGHRPPVVVYRHHHYYPAPHWRRW